MKFHYFELYCRGEPIRALLRHAKVDFEDVQIPLGSEKWTEFKKECEFGQVPIFEKDG